MMRIWRLVYYARRYWLQALSAVVLAAGVGLLDAFRVLLIGPIFDNVLHPGGATGSAKQSPLLGEIGARWHINITLQNLVPPRLHNDWAMIAFAFVASTLLKGIFDYSGTYLVNYAGLRHDHRHARRPLRRDPAPVCLLLPKARHRHAALHADQRH